MTDNTRALRVPNPPAAAAGLLSGMSSAAFIWKAWAAWDCVVQQR